MSRKLASVALGAMLFALCTSADAQQPAKVPRIGYLAAAPASTNPARIEAFRQGLRELGYVEGKNIVIEYRYTKPNRTSALASELVHEKVEVILTTGTNQPRLSRAPPARSLWS
jgi:putative ABC transport system substrate-binding protein